VCGVLLRHLVTCPLVPLGPLAPLAPLGLLMRAELGLEALLTEADPLCNVCFFLDIYFPPDVDVPLQV
jgi:hypothetical protein